MTVNEFAAITGMTKPQVRAEIRAGNLQAVMKPPEIIDGKKITGHYEITEDTAQWLKKRAKTTTPEKKPEKSPQNLQQSPQEQKTEGSSPMVIVGLSLLAIATFAGLLWFESTRNY